MVKSEERWYAIYDQSLETEHIDQLSRVAEMIPYGTDGLAFPDKGARVFLCLDDDGVKDMLPMARDQGWDLAPLPHPGGSWTSVRFGLEKGLEEAIVHALETSPTTFQLMRCNDIPVLSSVVAGESLTLDGQDSSKPRWGVFKSLVSGINKLSLTHLTMTTSKEQKYSTAGIGLIVLTGPGHPFLGETLKELVIHDDSRSTLILLAPRSILDYLSLLFRLVIMRTLGLRKLSSSVGIIRSQYILIESGKGVDFTLDGRPMSAKSLEIEISKEPLQVRKGSLFPPVSEQTIPEKDFARVSHLPQGDSVPILSGSPLPFFNHASEDEFRDLFRSLKETALFSKSFLALMVLSVLLALLGLYSSSSPVIIGAMILAPLMGPIISLSMGLARGQTTLILESLKTLTLGIGTALICAMVVASLLPLHILTGEMLARLSPNLLDLGVAVISGIAGAYASAKEDIAKSLAGVAIAVALVPPLCVAGIGLGWMNWSVIQGGFLLFATNLVGITVSASLTFLVLGFAPFRLAKRGLMLSLALLALVSAPLYFSFNELIEKNRIQEVISQSHFMVQDRKIHIEPLSILLRPEPLVRLQATAREPITGIELEIIRAQIINRLGYPVTVEMSVLLRR